MTIWINVKTGDILRLLVIATGVAGVVILAYHARTAVSMLIAAGFLALVISPAVDKLERRFPQIKRRVVALLVFMGLGLVVAFVVALLVPLITQQTHELMERIPVYLQQLDSGDGGIVFMDVDIKALMNSVYQDISGALAITTDLTINAASKLVSNAFIFFLTILLAYAFTVEGPGLVDTGRMLVPGNIRERMTSLGQRMHKAVTGFVGGQLIITSISASTTLIVAIVLGLPYPLSLAAIIWLTGLIPLVGNTIGAVVVILTALSQSFLVALGLTLFYIVYQQVENNLFEPYIQSHTVRLTPLYVLLSALIGVHIAGFLGALLAIPGGACVRILIDDVIDRSGN